MCDWVFNNSKKLPFVLQVNDIKLATFANSFPPLCIVVLCVWHSTYGKLNCFDFGMALLCSKKYEALLEKIMRLSTAVLSGQKKALKINS